MKQLVESVQAFAVAIGGLGLALIAFLDASFLSFPQVNDVLIVLMTLKEPAWMPYYAGMSLAGSTAGCVVLYFLARAGGQAVLRGRFEARVVDRAMHLTERYGLLTIMVTSTLPPPTPFKLFVAMAGAGGMSPAKFTTAVVVGRGVRYFGTGLLTLWYGEAVIDFLGQHGRLVALVLGLLLVAGVAAVALGRSRRARRRVRDADGVTATSKRPV